MNLQFKRRIDEKLERLSDKRVAEVLDFVEFLESRDCMSHPLREARENTTYLASVEQTLAEWFSGADERAHHVL